MLVLAAAAAGAQSRSLTPGIRVRVTTARAETGLVDGTIETLTRDSIVIRERARLGTPAELWRIALHDVAGIERFAGSTRRTARGALVGGVAGSAAGLLLSLLARGEPGERGCEGNELEIFGCEAVLTGASAAGMKRTTVALGIAGMLVGAVRGSVKRDRWLKAPESAWRPGIGLYAHRDGAGSGGGVELRWRF
jgi:hypothetical protein